MDTRGELWLIRHGETEWSRSGQHTSRTDLPLTPEGKRKAEALKPLLATKKFALVLSSPMSRAIETCHLAGFEPQITPDLCEWDYGEYEGRTTADIQRERTDWTLWKNGPLAGETAAQVGERSDRVIARAIAAGGDVALFAHGHVLRILAARWVELAAVGGEHFALSTGSISILGYEHDTRVFQLWNRSAV